MSSVVCLVKEKYWQNVLSELQFNSFCFAPVTLSQNGLSVYLLQIVHGGNAAVFIDSDNVRLMIMLSLFYSNGIEKHYHTLVITHRIAWPIFFVSVNQRKCTWQND